jgi:hypothetical protein
MATSEDDPESRDRFNAFRQGLSDAGWADGRTVRIETRWLSGDSERARRYATELVSLNPDVILANTALALQPLKQMAVSIPIVFVLVYDPVTSGFVASLARPGGNITGFTLGEFSYGGKMVETLKGVAAETNHIGVLMNPDQRPHVEMWRAIEEVTPSLKLGLTALHVRSPADLEASNPNLRRRATPSTCCSTQPDHRGSPQAGSRACGSVPLASRLRVSELCHERWAGLLRHRHDRRVPAFRSLRRSHPQWLKAHRIAGGAPSEG